MNTLWVLGDSFSEDATTTGYHQHSQLNNNVIEHQWHRLVAKELNMNLVNCGLSGSGLDYMYTAFYKIRPQIREGDIIVISMTDLARTWLFENARNSVPRMLEDFPEPGLTKQQIEAGKMFYIHLQHEKGRVALLKCFLWSLDYLTNVRSLLLPVTDYTGWILEKLHLSNEFSNIHSARGNLHEISSGEYNTKDIPWLDPRPNHLMPKNHMVLYQKILKWYHDGSSVDLRLGFHRGIITNHQTTFLQLSQEQESHG